MAPTIDRIYPAHWHPTMFAGPVNEQDNENTLDYTEEQKIKPGAQEQCKGLAGETMKEAEETTQERPHSFLPRCCS